MYIIYIFLNIGGKKKFRATHLWANLIAALTSLQVNDFPHFELVVLKTHFSPQNKNNKHKQIDCNWFFLVAFAVVVVVAALQRLFNSLLTNMYRYVCVSSICGHSRVTRPLVVAKTHVQTHKQIDSAKNISKSNYSPYFPYFTYMLACMFVCLCVCMYICDRVWIPTCEA